MNTKPTQCPNCNQPAAGNFCAHCGTPIVSTCPSCGTEVKPGTRVCHACGTSLTARATTKHWNTQKIAPWVAIGVAAVALVAVVVLLVGRGDRAAAPVSLQLPLTSTVPAPGEPLDLSSMSPRQAADRLFNRTMAASERGDSVEALRFAPMALQAYDGLGTLDNDAHYHVALINITAGDIASARVHIDNLQKAVPGHLLGIMLEHQIAERSGKQDSAGRAYKAFLAAYDAEIAMGRAEYQDHQVSIERFHKAAKANMAAKAKGDGGVKK